MHGGSEDSSGVSDDLEVEMFILSCDASLVEVSQDVHPRHTLPAGAFYLLLLGGWKRQHDIVGEHVILKHVALVNAIFLLQLWQQVRPAGDRKKNR